MKAWKAHGGIVVIIILTKTAARDEKGCVATALMCHARFLGAKLLLLGSMLLLVMTALMEAMLPFYKIFCRC